jgi:hypothetical protein
MLSPIRPDAAVADSGGTVKSICTYSHTAPDDPIVKPGLPGASHSHDFFGNTGTDAFTTLADLEAGETTCDFTEDRSAYWVPSLLINGNRVDPTHVAPYYTLRGADMTVVQPYPPGLMLVAGNSLATSPQPTSVTSWACEDGSQGSKQSSVPNCRSGQELTLKIQFPECWDGVSLDSADHKSHFNYLASNNATCPASHPVLVPTLGLIVHYPTSGGTGVTLSSGGQHSGHADFFNAWEPDRLQELIDDCLLTGMLCHSDEISVEDTTTTESGSATFALSLHEASPFPVEVDFTTLSDSAVAGADFSASSGHVVFAPYTLTKTVTVPIVNDTVGEATEQFFLQLSNPINATLSNAKATATITDDDTSPSASIADASIAEPNAGSRSLTFTVTLSAASGQEVTVNWSTVNATAAAPGDYTTKSGTLHFVAGSTVRTLIVRVNADAQNEGTEYFSVVLTSGTGIVIGDGSAKGTITPS